MSKATLRLWRLVKVAHAASPFDGEGAFRFGGRWNSKGQRMVYTSSSLALAALELLVHIDPAAKWPELLAFPIDLPLSEITDPPGWKTPPAELPPIWETHAIGDRWLAAGASLALRVPSMIVPVESNYLINPAHPRFASLSQGRAMPFDYDKRLLTGLSA